MQAAGDEAASREHRFLYSSKYAREFLRNKHVVIIGDSVQRYTYKDLISFLQSDDIVADVDIRKRFEESFANDTLMRRSEISAGINCYEFREYQSTDGFHLVQFHFVTRCFNEDVQELVLEEFEKESPDVVIMNSCLWDVTRYGAPDDCLKSYQEMMMGLLRKLQKVLRPNSLFIWCSALPIASKLTAKGVILDEMDFQKESLRVQILEANYHVTQIVQRMGFDVLDLHFYLRPLILKHRCEDGVHWSGVAHRHITDLLLTFLHETWGEPMPQGVIDKLFGSEISSSHMKHLSFDVRLPKFTRLQLQHLESIANKLMSNKVKAKAQAASAQPSLRLQENGFNSVLDANSEQQNDGNRSQTPLSHDSTSSSHSESSSGSSSSE